MRSSCFSPDPARNGRVRPLAQVESLDSLFFQQFATCFLNLTHHHLNISSLPTAYISSILFEQPKTSQHVNISSVLDLTRSLRGQSDRTLAHTVSQMG